MCRQLHQAWPPSGCHSMSFIAAIIFAAILLSGLLDIYLERRQGTAVHAHRDLVPAEFAGHVSLEEHRRAADYTLARTLVSMVQTGFDTILAVLWLGFFLAPVAAVLAHFVAPGLSRSVAIVIAVAVIGYILHLP